MGQVLHAIRVFFEQLAAVDFAPLALAVGIHLVKTFCTSRAWRNAIAAAYPDRAVPQRSIYGAYIAAVGVNAVVPARGGDAVKLYLAHRSVDGASYATLAATLFVLSLFDIAMGGLIFGYALTLGVLPGVGALPHLAAFDFGWVGAYPELAIVLALVLAILVFFGGTWLRFRVHGLKARLAQGVVVLRDRERYLRTVATWQACDWALRFVAIWFFLDAFGIAQSVRNVLLVQVTQSLATLVPVSPGGIGTEQAFIVYVFDGAVSTTRLLSFSVGMKLTLVAANVAAGFTAIFLMLGHVRWREAAAGRPAPGG
ncbi:MAG TPA: lysylphosphatidylglycerol synthase transmembrane domain-containing protein [Gaiellaceae bacterium]|nr:lysylphosphatidylglycerol synthase transmembrane domain-containing protein [Gaiellaceae bacterium]